MRSTILIRLSMIVGVSVHLCAMEPMQQPNVFTLKMRLKAFPCARCRNAVEPLVSSIGYTQAAAEMTPPGMGKWRDIVKGALQDVWEGSENGRAKRDLPESAQTHQLCLARLIFSLSKNLNGSRLQYYVAGHKQPCSECVALFVGLASLVQSMHDLKCMIRCTTVTGVSPNKKLAGPLEQALAQEDLESLSRFHFCCFARHVVKPEAARVPRGVSRSTSDEKRARKKKEKKRKKKKHERIGRKFSEERE